MSNWLALLLMTAAATAIWPVARWAMHHAARPAALGLVMVSVVLCVDGGLALALHSPLLVPMAWGLGSIGGVCYAVGFVLIIFHCLRIGPTGPTVTLNNLGMVWPILIGMIWSVAAHGLQWAGVACTGAALVLTGFINRAEGPSMLPLTPRWARWALLGWLFAGLSMSSQYLSGQWVPHAPYAYVVAWSLVALVVLLVAWALGRHTRFTRVEVAAGLATGLISALTLPLQLWLLGRMAPFIVFPVTIAGPVIVILLLGQFAFRERLNLAGWSASLLGVAGILLLALG